MEPGRSCRCKLTPRAPPGCSDSIGEQTPEKQIFDTAAGAEKQSGLRPPFNGSCVTALDGAHGFWSLQGMCWVAAGLASISAAATDMCCCHAQRAAGGGVTTVGAGPLPWRRSGRVTRRSRRPLDVSGSGGGGGGTRLSWRRQPPAFEEGLQAGLAGAPAAATGRLGFPLPSALRRLAACGRSGLRMHSFSGLHWWGVHGLLHI